MGVEVLRPLRLCASLCRVAPRTRPPRGTCPGACGNRAAYGPTSQRPGPRRALLPLSLSSPVRPCPGGSAHDVSHWLMGTGANRAPLVSLLVYEECGGCGPQGRLPTRTAQSNGYLSPTKQKNKILFETKMLLLRVLVFFFWCFFSHPFAVSWTLDGQKSESPKLK
ncbi:hypothetical protein SETIT_3G045300v2 [Setaria italica]|uniref:Uncharacterized protein n=1 Tax=Setaria italica TaxID=4555 RepID=A0A368QBB1_SETIT|nr:hypothetical protein SETIT_3G045300v2 [Setaria italica]